MQRSTSLFHTIITTLVVSLVGIAPIESVFADEVNIYSARQESLIKPLLDRFTQKTGIKTVANQLKDAADKGAHILTHPGPLPDGENYILPAILTNVNHGMDVMMEETFGPAIPIIRVKNIDDAIRIANGTNFGLSSGVCTNRFDDITRFINELNHGTVNIWEVPGYRIEMSPFGGIKDSGLGYKEGVIEAMKSFTNLKTFSMPWM